jgi:hypothetical protein
MSLPRPVGVKAIQIFKDNQLTIGLDLGDRSSRYPFLWTEVLHSPPFV